MTTATAHDDRVGKLHELIRHIPVAMLTTATPDGGLRSRPMMTCRPEEGGDLWFFTHASDPKVAEAQRHPAVNVTYVDTTRDRYVSVSGTARLVCDRGTVERLWDPSARAWFPNGPDDPDLALLAVSVERAEYWEGKAGLTFEDVKLDLRGAE